MIKKLLSGLFTTILLLLITILSSVLITRTMLSDDTISNILNVLTTNNNETINTDDINIEENVNENILIEDIINDVLDETTIPNEVLEYFNKEEIKEYLNNYLTQYIKYGMGMSEMPSLNTKEFNVIINSAIEEYENKTGNKVNKEEIQEIITEVDQTIAKQELPSNPYIDLFQKVMRLCFDNKTIYILIALIVITLLIITLLGGLRILFKKISSTLIVNSVILTLFSLVLSFIANKNELLTSILKIIIKDLNIYAYTSFGIGVVIFILLIFFKPKEKEVTDEVNPK